MNNREDIDLESTKGIDFIRAIVHRVYMGNTTIGGVRFKPFDFIDELHNRAEFKGLVFYENLRAEFGNHFGKNVLKAINNDQSASFVFDKFYQFCSKRITEYEVKAEPPPPKKRLTAPTIALFCSYINDAKIIARGNENLYVYCKKVCDRFGLEYRERVAKNFFGSDTEKNRNGVKEQIFPRIEVHIKDAIEGQMNRKH